MPKKEALILFLKTSLLSCRADKEEWIGEAWKLSPAKHQKNVRVDKQVSWDTMSKVQHIAPCVWIDEILQLILSIYFVSAQTSLKLMSNRLNFILLFQLHKVQWTISFFFFFFATKMSVIFEHRLSLQEKSPGPKLTFVFCDREKFLSVSGSWFKSSVQIYICYFHKLR